MLLEHLLQNAKGIITLFSFKYLTLTMLNEFFTEIYDLAIQNMQTIFIASTVGTI